MQYVDGRSATAAFPKLVAAEQPVKGLHDLRVMAHEVEPGVWAELSFAGAVFETEDQRNWIDASYKTFCTPLRIPYPVEVKAGTRIHQAVTLKIAGIEDRRIENETDPRPQQFSNSEFAILTSQSSAPITITLGTGTRILPAIGTGAASHGQPLALREIKLLRRLHLTHVRLDVRFRANDWRESLARALRAAEGLECPLELALHVDAGAPADFTSLVEALTHDRSRSWEFLIRARAFKRMSLFTAGARTTTTAALAAARKFLRKMDTPLHELPLGGGTDADFYQLNQFRPQADGMDFVSWSMNPQVHAFDAASLAETPLAIAAQIESAKEFFPGAPLVVSPVTLKPRFNPVATGPETPTPPGELPPQVDPRQLSLFGAGWTLAALKQLAEAGVASATCFETTGWRGVMETDTGSPLPEKFPSIPGAVFPLYHVLADIGEFAGGEVITSHSSDSLKVESLALRHDGRRALLLANLTDDPQRVRVRPFAAAVDIRRLDEANARQSMTDPEKFRAGSRETRHASNDTLELTLPPFGLARLDAHD